MCAVLVQQLCKAVAAAKEKQLHQRVSVLAVLLDRQPQLTQLPEAAAQVLLPSDPDAWLQAAVGTPL